jgi:hypothetical protein
VICTVSAPWFIHIEYERGPASRWPRLALPIKTKTKRNKQRHPGHPSDVL